MIVENTTKLQRIAIKEGGAPFLMARVTDKAGTAILKASITAITVTIENIETGEKVKDATALSKNTVWFDTLQTGDEWEADTTGYNFGYQTEAADFVTSRDDQTFRLEVWVDPTSGENFSAGWWEIVVEHSVVSTSEEPA